ncbi:hypothetical protein M514_10626 [Trichuris suis]|uniref:Uncharacterized protein n=1 Tax=Trichuris suis TaxID=68888 RepID=A0A085NJQ4_9BILA|nr:hypothetical protein M513_10626 [Trichuris suis]KFD69700.1 hypothetical protein M514_10626 [Trichuris suis]
MLALKFSRIPMQSNCTVTRERNLLADAVPIITTSTLAILVNMPYIIKVLQQKNRLMVDVCKAAFNPTVLNGGHMAQLGALRGTSFGSITASIAYIGELARLLMYYQRTEKPVMFLAGHMCFISALQLLSIVIQVVAVYFLRRGLSAHTTIQILQMRRQTVVYRRLRLVIGFSFLTQVIPMCLHALQQRVSVCARLPFWCWVIQPIGFMLIGIYHMDYLTTVAAKFMELKHHVNKTSISIIAKYKTNENDRRQRRNNNRGLD